MDTFLVLEWFWNRPTTKREGKVSFEEIHHPQEWKEKKKGISPATVDQPSSPSKTKQAKRNLNFSEKGKEILAQSENILNFPYSDSKEEKEQEVDLTEQVAA